MELQNFIDASPDYINILKSTNLIVKRFSKYGLYLLKYPYEKEINIDSYERYCRGALIDMNTNKVVFIPPSKASQITLLENEVDCIQELYDGTMINMIYRNNEWILSTRSDIGLNNKWDSKSFKQMFEECGPINYDELNKEYTYSFVMQHVDNRNISIVNDNKLILVEVRHNLQLVDLSTIGNNGFLIAQSLTPENIETCMNILRNNSFSSFSWKGLTYKKNNKRYNIINPMFENVNELKINSNNPLYNFIHLWKTDKLKDYLYFFNEYTSIFEKYKTLLNICIKELYDNYVQIKIKKSKESNDVPFQLKPLIYNLHGVYLEHKKKITYNVTEQFFKGLETERSTFVLKYYVSL